MTPMRTPSCACLLAGCGPVAASHVARMAFLCRADHSRASLRLSQTSAFPFGKFRASLEAVLCRNLPAPGHALQLPAVPLLSPTPPARVALLPSAWPAPPLPVWPLNTLNHVLDDTSVWQPAQALAQDRETLGRFSWVSQVCNSEAPWEASDSPEGATPLQFPCLGCSPSVLWKQRAPFWHQRVHPLFLRTWPCAKPWERGWASGPAQNSPLHRG